MYLSPLDPPEDLALADGVRKFSLIQRPFQENKQIYNPSSIALSRTCRKVLDLNKVLPHPAPFPGHATAVR